MNCPHFRRVIEGVHWFGATPKQVLRVCLDCGERWGDPWSRASDNEKAEAYVTDEVLRPRSPEMTPA